MTWHDTGRCEPDGDVHPVLPAPALGVFGWSGSGKTTVMEAVIPTLVARGLRVAVLKGDVHGLDVDHPGKDSDRLFRAGADVLLGSQGERLLRTYRRGPESLASGLAALLADHDLVLVEGNRATRIPKVWLASETEPEPPHGLDNILEVFPRDQDRPRRLLNLIDSWLPRTWSELPVLGGVLIGARTRSKGATPSAKLRTATHIESISAALAPISRSVVLLGRGPVPERCRSLPLLSDPLDAAGPLAGMLAAQRWAPGSAWIFCPCDLPNLRSEALEWLLAQRRPGRWVVLPRTASGLHPLLAVYEQQARLLLEQVLASGELAPRLVLDHPKVATVWVPPELEACWRDARTGRRRGSRQHT